ncbi:type II toxin-antitoxin system VapC family toxin [Georgenia sunbinii]|uniref:type II toxin-antitoxin system VapC family toxin n=1 Tax=Georgenia sunbinii TaxID=3117728 RepID=UPI002F261143
MIVDTSALVAILANEPERSLFTRMIGSARPARICAATLVEARVVVEARLGPRQRRRLDALLRELEVEVVAFDEQQATIASEAYRDYGKGSGHPARLNLGDSYSYALASRTGEPLLFKGNNFGYTDLRPAVG